MSLTPKDNPTQAGEQAGPLTEQQADAPTNPSRRRLLEGLAAVGMASAVPLQAQALPAATVGGSFDHKLKTHIKHVVVIYLENRSFNNLFGNFPGVQSPLSALPPEAYTQMDRDGRTPLAKLPKIWGGLVPRRQAVGGKEYLIGENDIPEMPNAPFPLRHPDGSPLPEGVITRDLWHLFYQNQMQINGGKNDQFAAWANSGGLVMGYYGETDKNLNLWKIAQRYTLCDNFFMSAFGGSYLNHLFLIGARPPVYPNAAEGPARNKIAVVDGDPTSGRLKVASDCAPSARDALPKFVRDGSLTPDGYSVNTMAPPYQPSFVGPAKDGDPRLADPSNPNTLPPQNYTTIGDLLSKKGVDWAWYAGGWQDALDKRGGPDIPYFQYHHQPFNYFVNYAPGTEARDRHLRDGGTGDSPISNKFLGDVVSGNLPAVTFYKPQGNLNMHAGYADVESGDRHVANVLAHLENGPQWANMMVIITPDENGGWWDHVAPPQGDRWGPGSRIPALVVSPFAKQGFVDHTMYDTTSILRFITRLHDLPVLEGIAARNQAFAARGATPPGDLSGTLSFA